jgi:hypothetical protein
VPAEPSYTFVTPVFASVAVTGAGVIDALAAALVSVLATE